MLQPGAPGAPCEMGASKLETKVRILSYIERTTAGIAGLLKAWSSSILTFWNEALVAADTILLILRYCQ